MRVYHAKIYRAKMYHAPFAVRLDKKAQQFLAVRQPRVYRTAPN
jgi:hypothetical protein